MSRFPPHRIGAFVAATVSAYATTPVALKSFQKLQDVHDAGYQNKDFASTKLENGLKMLAEGAGVHYPMLTFAVATIAANNPDKINDVGFFALPGDDAAKAGLTVWEPGGVYIPRTTTGAKLDAGQEVPGVRGEQGGL
jgi:raffinose/stachyose/melibiose transport system substrate-binding protein